MKGSNNMKASKGLVAGFWIFTALFCLEMSFTAYYELLRLPEAAQAFTRLGFPAAYFRVELSWAKVAGVAALLVPMVPARLKAGLFPNGRQSTQNSEKAPYCRWMSALL